jgi:hypothetical protein
LSYEPGNCVIWHRDDPDRPRKAIPTLLVCLGHYHRLARQVRQLGPLDRVLAARAANPAAVRTGSKSAETRIPLHEAAAITRREIRQVLASWTLMLCQEQRLHGPDFNSGRGLVSWLLAHHDDFCAHPAVDDYFTEIGDLHRRAMAICYPFGNRRVPVAPCECGGHLQVALREDGGLVDAECDTCGAVLPPYRWLRRIDRDTWLTAVELSALWDIPLRTVQRWATDDDWLHDGARPARYSAKDADKTYQRMRPEGVSA